MTGAGRRDALFGSVDRAQAFGHRPRSGPRRVRGECPCRRPL